jgi:hypothetical protein
MRWEEHIAHKGGMRSAYKVLVGKSEGKKPLGRHRRKWEGKKLILKKSGGRV